MGEADCTDVSSGGSAVGAVLTGRKGGWAVSRLSFQTFCIEFYSHHIKQSSDKVFRLFEREGVLDLLEREYEDLHGMGMEYMMQFLDEYLGEQVEI
jgi:hypothetical protein